MERTDIVVKKYIFLAACFLISFFAALNLTSNLAEAEGQSNQELIKEWESVVADPNKAYTIYVSMPRKDFDANFANAGWQRKEYYDFDGNPCVRLEKGSKVICAYFTSKDGVVAGFSIHFFTNNKTIAMLMYNKAKENFVSLFGQGKTYPKGNLTMDWSRKMSSDLVISCIEYPNYPSKANTDRYIITMGGPILGGYSAYVFRK